MKLLQQKLYPRFLCVVYKKVFFFCLPSIFLKQAKISKNVEKTCNKSEFFKFGESLLK